MPYLGDPDLVNWIIAANPLVLVIDPLQAFLPNTANMNNANRCGGCFRTCACWHSNGGLPSCW